MHSWVYLSCLVFIAQISLASAALKSIKPKSVIDTHRASILQTFTSFTSVLSTAAIATTVNPSRTLADDVARQLEYMPALQGLDYGKPRTLYPDFIAKKSGLQYKIVKAGNGPLPENGDKVVVDWEGYTIGYYGRPFQTRNKVKGGAFESSETDYYRFTVGASSTIKALNEAITYLPEGTVAQVIVPAELGYPVTGDSEHDLVGPKPNTFSGLRALNFVLENTNLIDKTLLINVKVVRVDKGGKR